MIKQHPIETVVVLDTRAADRPAEPAAQAVSAGAVAAATVYAVLVAGVIGHFLLGIPIQVSDCVENMLELTASWQELLARRFLQPSYLRPFLWAELKLVFDISGGNYVAWFRGVHVAQMFALVVLYLALVRPRRWRDAALLPFGLAVLFGVHTFKGTAIEAFPVNTFLTIVLCCLAAANLALMKHRWWVDVLAVALFVVAALTVESGLLVGVIFIGAALLGARGLSRAGIIAIGTTLAGYFILRFWVLQLGSPGLVEHPSGFGFSVLEPQELVDRFGAHPARFYAYNIATSALSVLFAEPRAGIFSVVHGLVSNNPDPAAVLNFIASLCATMVIAMYAWDRRAAWRARDFDRDDRIVLLFMLVLAANAAISYPYTKDVIMSPAGALFAAAVFVAARRALGRSHAIPPMRAVAVFIFCAVLGVTWAVRFAALPMNLREAGRKVRNEWAYVDQWLARQDIKLDDPRTRALIRQLRDAAVYQGLTPPHVPAANNRWLDVD